MALGGPGGLEKISFARHAHDSSSGDVARPAKSSGEGSTTQVGCAAGGMRLLASHHYTNTGTAPWDGYAAAVGTGLSGSRSTGSEECRDPINNDPVGCVAKKLRSGAIVRRGAVGHQRLAHRGCDLYTSKHDLHQVGKREIL